MGNAVTDMGTVRFYRCPQAAMRDVAELVPVHALHRDRPNLATQVYPQPTVAAIEAIRVLADTDQKILKADVDKAEAEARRRGGRR